MERRTELRERSVGKGQHYIKLLAALHLRHFSEDVEDEEEVIRKKNRWPNLLEMKVMNRKCLPVMLVFRIPNISSPSVVQRDEIVQLISI